MTRQDVEKHGIGIPLVCSTGISSGGRHRGECHGDEHTTHRVDIVGVFECLNKCGCHGNQRFVRLPDKGRAARVDCRGAVRRAGGHDGQGNGCGGIVDRNLIITRTLTATRALSFNHRQVESASRQDSNVRGEKTSSGQCVVQQCNHRGERCQAHVPGGETEAKAVHQSERHARILVSRYTLRETKTNASSYSIHAHTAGACAIARELKRRHRRQWRSSTRTHVSGRQRM